MNIDLNIADKKCKKFFLEGRKKILENVHSHNFLTIQPPEKNLPLDES